MSNRIFRWALATGLGLASIQMQGLASDWHMWGGSPNRNMYSSATNLPDRVDAGSIKPGTEEVDLSTTKNVKWAAHLGSQSYGNVTVAQGRVFIGTNNDHPRNAAYEGDHSILMVFDEKTGKFLWQLVVPKLKSGKVNDWEGLGILSSPIIEGNRVYLVTTRCEVICLDINGLADGNQGLETESEYIVKDTEHSPKPLGPTDADIIWVYDMINELGVFPHNASSSSPLIIGDLIYVCTSNGQDWSHVNIPSPLSPSYIAINKKTGELAGEDDAGIGPRIFHGQFSSPAAGQVGGKWQLYAGGGDGVLYAFDPQPKKAEETSYLRKIWWFDCNPPEYKVKNGKPIKYPAADGPSEITATPVFYKNRVYVAIGQDPEHGEGIGRLVCVDATKTGDITAGGPIWEYRGIFRSMSTVSIDPTTGLLFVGDFSGFVHCLDAETGKEYWTHDMKSHMWGSTMVADGKVYVGDEEGDLTILAATKEKKVISEANLGGPVYSTPVIANGILYVGSSHFLYAFFDSARAAGLPDQPRKVDVKLGDPAP